MADPFEILRQPVTPVAPDPLFAASLRARMAERLHQGGMPVSITATTAPTTATAGPATVVPYLIVDDARRALDWYRAGLGARLLGAPLVMPDGRVGHAEIDVGGAVLYVADESPSSRVAAPRPGEPARVSLTLEVADVDAAVDRAARAGAEVERAAADHPHGRNAVVRDPFGHRWIVASPAVPARAGTVLDGDVVYVSLWLPDVERARRFYGGALGWELRGQGAGHALAVEGAAPRHGLWQRPGEPLLLVCYAVGDLDAALDRLRAAGGRVERLHDEGSGRIADCLDDTGAPLSLHQGAVGQPRSAPAGGPEIAYLTLSVPDTTRARAFYGTVLGWRFAPGHTPGGWNVTGVEPVLGLGGGGGEATRATPMYRVPDIEAAVRRVRDAGGMATEPAAQPYGVAAWCSDDQGAPFHLGELP